MPLLAWILHPTFHPTKAREEGFATCLAELIRPCILPINLPAAVMYKAPACLIRTDSVDYNILQQGVEV